MWCRHNENNWKRKFRVKSPAHLTYRITLIAEHTDPQFGTIVNLTHRIQNALAWIASWTNDWIVIDYWQIVAFFQRLIKTTQWNDESLSIDPTRRPHIPSESNTVSIFILLNVFLVRGHLVWKLSFFLMNHQISKPTNGTLRFL